MNATTMTNPIQNTTEIIKFPTKELDFTALNWIRERNQMVARENVAQTYSRECKKKALHEDIMYIVSGLAVCASIVALYFVLIKL